MPMIPSESSCAHIRGGEGTQTFKKAGVSMGIVRVVCGGGSGYGCVCVCRDGGKLQEAEGQPEGRKHLWEEVL